jgi:hypothetical protein
MLLNKLAAVFAVLPSLFFGWELVVTTGRAWLYAAH